MLSSWHSHGESSQSSRYEYRMAPSGRQPLDNANWLEPQARLQMQPVKRIHRRHLLLLSPKADTHFTVTRRVED